MYNVTIIYNCYHIDAILNGKERNNDTFFELLFNILLQYQS